jgi:hypothetical protein
VTRVSSQNHANALTFTRNYVEPAGHDGPREMCGEMIKNLTNFGLVGVRLSMPSRTMRTSSAAAMALA